MIILRGHSRGDGRGSDQALGILHGHGHSLGQGHRQRDHDKAQYNDHQHDGVG